MKNLKTTILTAFIAICCLTNGNAQETARKNRGKVVMTGSPGSIIAFGGGTSMPSSDAKDKAFLSNSTAINADAFFSLISKPETNFSFGLNFGGAYNFGGSGGFGTIPNPFAVTGQTSSMVSDKGTDPAQATFRMGAGPQANFYFGKFIVSPMVLGEYFSMSQKERSSVQTTQFNGQSYDFNLATLPETKTSGFAVTPKLRLHYMFNDRFGLFADASYTMGPKIETTVSKLIPNGNPSPQSGSYNIQQLQTGTMVKGETKSTAYSAMGFNFGVVIGLGKNGNKGWNGVAETAQSFPTNQNTMPTNGIVKPACTCCGSKVHDRIDCPDITRCNTQTASSQVALSDDLPKAQGDIKKGWDGTVKGLFVGKNTDILVTKNGGVDKFIEQINKVGKGKASIEKYGDNQFVKIINKKEEVSYYPVENSPQFTIINSGGFVCNSTCSSCGPVVSLGPCICGSPTGPISTGGENPLPVACGSPISVPVLSYLPHLNTEALATPLSIDNNGNLTATSVKEIEQLLLAQIPNLVFEKTEIIKEGKESYIVVSVKNFDKPAIIVNKLERRNVNSLAVSIFWSLISCNGICGDAAGCANTKPVFGSSTICPCSAGGGLKNCNPVPYYVIVNPK
jgi:hypothetical protein